MDAHIVGIPTLETGVEDDWVDLRIDHESGVRGEIHLDFVQRPPVHVLRAWGDLGKVKFDYHRQTIVWTDSSGHCEQERCPPSFERNEMFLAAMRDFFIAIESGHRELHSSWGGYRGFASGVSGAPVSPNRGSGGKMNSKQGTALAAFSMEGKRCCVTGAGGLLGKEFVKTLAEAGARIAAIDINRETCFESLEYAGGT